jgi:hypothetical protein
MRFFLISAVKLKVLSRFALKLLARALTFAFDQQKSRSPRCAGARPRDSGVAVGPSTDPSGTGRGTVVAAINSSFVPTTKIEKNEVFQAVSGSLQAVRTSCPA